MCEATVIMNNDMKNKEIMKEVEYIEENDGSLRIIDIMGREITVNARITKVDLVKNQIFVSEKS